MASLFQRAAGTWMGPIDLGWTGSRVMVLCPSFFVTGAVMSMVL